MAHVIAVIGGSGGVGASTLAAALALAGAPSLLVDLDPLGGGIDVLLGMEHAPGARWSGLRLAGGNLDCDALLAGLPRWPGGAVLAADRGTAIAPAGLDQVLASAAGAPAIGTVVLDLPRPDAAVCEVALARSELVVVLARAEISTLTATHALVGRLGPVTAALVLRRGSVRPAQAAQLCGLPLLGVLAALRGSPLDLASGRPPRATRRLAGAVLAGLAAVAGPAAVPAPEPLLFDLDVDLLHPTVRRDAAAGTR